jgi:DNA-binding MarR family transcriptional regulator
MDESQLQSVRRFNRVVTQRIGVLDVDYLRRGRPLAEARLLFEISPGGADVRALRSRLGLDSGYLSRLLQSLKTHGLVVIDKGEEDARRRRVSLTRKGAAERSAYDRLSDKLAASMLEPLNLSEQNRLLTAMGEVERLIRAASVNVAADEPDSPDARLCLAAYFRELAARFEGGFDIGVESSAPVADMAPPSGLFVIARLDGEAIGCGGLKRVDETTGEIKRVWTAPSVRGLGIARRMLRTLEGAARKERLKTLRLDTNRALTEAHALYRSEGYQEIPRFNDNPYADHWFEKRL